MTDAPPLIKVHCNMVMKQRRGGIALGACTHPSRFVVAGYETALANYRIITPEVAGGYWWISEEGWGAMDWIYAYAIKKQKHLVSYPLRWWYPDKETQPVDIEAWISEVMTRYPMIMDWQVINEGYSGGQPTISAIDESCLFARKIRPEARFWYNGLLFDPYEQEQALSLVSRGLLDGIGIQMHHNLLTDFSSYYPLLEQCKALAIPWRVTELDVCIPNTSAECLLDQAECYRQVVDLVHEYGGENVTMWGVGDWDSWQRDYYPLPWDRAYQPKAAWEMLKPLPK